MTKVAILGCGYTGAALVPRLLEAGHEVVATTTTAAKVASLERPGVEVRIARLDHPEEVTRALAGVRRVIHLAPPDRDRPVLGQVEALVRALPDGLEAYVYGSTTGAFGNHPDPQMWIDETTPSRNLGGGGQVRRDFERELAAAGLPLRVARIAGIYGPGRTMKAALDRGLVLFEEGPRTSRTHVDDLARLLAALVEDGAPPLAIACDEDPTPTLEVAKYTCGLLGRALPPVLTKTEARQQMSPRALEMRMGGRRCRSLVREGLIGALQYPTYREGVKASLLAEGVNVPSA